MLAQFLHWMGYGLCHQLPERSFFGGGIQVPVCARDTGIYIGIVASLGVLAALHRGERPRGFARPPVWVLMGLLLLFMAWDGVTSYGGFRTTTNALRLITGLGTGFSAAVVLYPMLQDELWKRGTQGAVLDPLWRLVVWVATIPVCFAAVWWGAPWLGAGYPLLVAVCILVTLSTINLVIVAMFPMFDRKAERLRGILAPSAISLLIAFAEVALAGQLRAFLEGVARSL